MISLTIFKTLVNKSLILYVSLLNYHFSRFIYDNENTPLLEKAKLAREISDGKNEISHKFLSRKI